MGVPRRSLTASLVGFVALATVLLGVWAAPAAADTFRVKSTADTGPDSLRRAITQANNNAGPDTIRFRIAGTGVKTIKPASPLPDITDPVTVNGYSQPGASANTLAQGSDAVLLIQLNGADAGVANGLIVQAGGSTIRGLVINRFAGNGILLSSGADNVVAGNYIGTDDSGTARRANDDDGVDISGSDNNTVGGVAAADRNVLSGNAGDGVQVTGGLGTTGNQVVGNYVGTDRNGVADLGNTAAGVLLFSVQDNVVGGTNSAARNVISGNGGDGVRVLGNASLGVATGNQVLGNFVGTDANGTADLGNTGAGVEVQDARANTIGGGVASARNVISSNDDQGVAISGNLGTGNLVLGNYVGTDEAGTADLGNGGDGVQISSGADENTVGGTDGAKLNVISGNGGDGVDIVGGLLAADNQILGNHIGTDEDGTTALGNAEDGVHISAESNTVGGTTTGARNVISGNVGDGVQMIGEGDDNVVSGNYIGTDVGGTASLGNGLRGVQISSGAIGNTTGGTVAGARNVISGNGGDGVQIGEHPAVDPPARQNTVLGNFIGVDATGNAALPNLGGDGGVDISNADDNTIGGTTAAARNVISGNANDGVVLFGTEATGNDVQGNFIGTGANGTTALGNDDGIVISSANATTIGGTTTGAGNRIANNRQDGVLVAGGLAVGNRVLSNSIFSNGEIGIDLGPEGPTANDDDDPDAPTFSNHLQNFPVITDATRDLSESRTTISLTLNSNPNQTYTVQCFIAAPDNTSGHGEGATLVRQTTATTNASGNDNDIACTRTTVPAGSQVTATATNITTGSTFEGDTSEFSENELVDAVP